MAQTWSGKPQIVGQRNPRTPPCDYEVSRPGFSVRVSVFEVSGSRFRGQCVGFRVLGPGFEVQGFACWVPGFEFRVWGFVFGVWGLGFRISGVKFRFSKPETIRGLAARRVPWLQHFLTGFGCTVSGSGHSVSGFECRAHRP